MPFHFCILYFKYCKINSLSGSSRPYVAGLGAAGRGSGGLGAGGLSLWAGSLTLWLRPSPPCLPLPFFASSHLSPMRNEHCWLTEQRTAAETSRVSVNDGWLLEYKWDVLIHLNQGHMLGPESSALKAMERQTVSATLGNLQTGCSYKLTWFHNSLISSAPHSCPDILYVCLHFQFLALA